MKKNQELPVTRSATVALVIIAMALILNSCGISSALRSLDQRAADAIHSLDNAIAMLAQESSDWQVVVSNLESQLTTDLQSLVDNEINNLIQNSIHSGGTELRCNAEYMRIKLRRELIDIRNNFVEGINAGLSNSPFSAYEIPLLPQEEPTPYICDVVPSHVDMSIENIRRSVLDVYGFDFKSLPITVSYRSQGLFKPKRVVRKAEFTSTLRQANLIISRSPALIATEAFDLASPVNVFSNDISASISIISDFHAVIDLTESGGNLPPNATDIIISCQGKILSEIPILEHESTLVCTTTEKLVTPGSKSFIPPAVTNSPYGGHPDKEFAGHGPCVTFRMNLRTNPSANELYATYYMDAWECPDDYSKIRKDYTQAVGSETMTLFSAGADETILSFAAQSVFNDKYIDTDHSPDIRYFGGTAPVSKLEYTGDTSGDEAGTETGVVITFRPFKVQIQKCEYR